MSNRASGIRGPELETIVSLEELVSAGRFVGRLPKYRQAPGGNPYFDQPKKVDPNVYLSGGQDFGQVAIDAMFNPTGPHIISRNLTPDYTGRVEGGNTFEQFLQK
jgi:hypothetical protein